MFWKKKTPKYRAPQVTDDNFDEIVSEAIVPVLLDFYAAWCGPCKILGPFIDELAEEFAGRAVVAKIDVDANPRLVKHFKIKSMPTIIFVSSAKVVERFTGLIPKPNLEEILNAYIDDPED